MIWVALLIYTLAIAFALCMCKSAAIVDQQLHAGRDCRSFDDWGLD